MSEPKDTYDPLAWLSDIDHELQLGSIALQPPSPTDESDLNLDQLGNTPSLPSVIQRSSEPWTMFAAGPHALSFPDDGDQAQYRSTIPYEGSPIEGVAWVGPTYPSLGFSDFPQASYVLSNFTQCVK